MGQKTNPIGFRLGIIKSWESRWFSEKDYSKLLQEDINIRKFLLKKLSSAGISKVVIERPAKLAKIDAVIETRGPEHVDEIIADLRAANFVVNQLDDSTGH